MRKLGIAAPAKGLGRADTPHPYTSFNTDKGRLDPSFRLMTLITPAIVTRNTDRRVRANLAAIMNIRITQHRYKDFAFGLAFGGNRDFGLRSECRISILRVYSLHS